ncbi:zinc finger protein 385D [Sphaeramia orbicularis]|uniref:C2H2-type domain-containing protein n=1 Tax=Sphaeramia orbicularis TaxID=375764 RepID=A0A673BAQ4_9TELE|nr:zinc finger protein 385D [Sphaeramia orbicularis]
MDSSMFFGNTCQNGLMPALVRPTLPAVQPSLAMKQFLPFPLETASAISLFPGFNTMDPVQKAVLHHTLGLPPTAKRKHVSCSICQLRFNSQSQALAHYKGTKHAKKLKALDAPKSKLKGSAVAKETTNQEIAKGINTLQVPNSTDRKDAVPGAAPLPLSPVLRPAQPPATQVTPTANPTPAPAASPLVPSTVAASGPETTSAAGEAQLGSASDPDPEPKAEPEGEPEVETDPETEEEKARRLLYCSLCKVAVNSTSQLEAHNSGTKHKTMLEARSGVGSIKSFPRPGVKSKLATVSASSTGLQNKTFYCETCDVHVNSETQLKQHISSRRHKDRAAGKPAKPKYSPYSKPQKGQAKQPIKLSLGKDLQPLPTQIIPAHLAAVAAAAAAINNTFGHRTTPATNHTPTPALFPSQSLPTTLLRPAPGPVRTSHPQVLFAPY